MLLTEEKSADSKATVPAEKAALRINQALETSDFEKAYHWLGELTQSTPDSSQVHTTAGLVALQLDRQGEAVVHFARALKLSPDDYVTNYNMAISELQHQRYDLALDRLRHLRRLDPSKADVLNDLGVVYLQKNQPSRALASFSRAMKLDPDHAMARNNAMEFCLNNGLMERAATMLGGQEQSPHLSLQAQIEIHCWQKILCDPSNPQADVIPVDAGSEN